ncbi:MAG: YcaO-like family protein [Jatrophihabitans sp.]
MKFTSQMKYGTDGIPRVVRAEETIQRVKPVMSKIGVTRIADTTGLDTLGMPIFSAIRPTDAGPDGISVYNGKGATKAASLAGAMMEAIERYCAESWHGDRQKGARPDIQAANPDVFVMDPSTMILQQKAPYEVDRTALEWVEGWDLLNDRRALIPLALILAPYLGPGEDIWYCSSNGLASGNNPEEAVVHGLAELIERDAYTIAAVRAQLVPRVRYFLDHIGSADIPEENPVDRSHSPSIRLDTVPPPVRRLVRAAQRSKSELWLRDVTSDLGIPTFIASMRLAESDGSELVAGGFGCDPNSTIAAIRAITEAAQGRNVQIQGVREDASAARAVAPSKERVLWCHDSDRWISFSEVPSYENQDILDDINLMLDRLRSSGVREAYAVDVSDPDIPASVTKVIVPEMEAWFLRDFAENQSRLGWRSQRYLPTK